jgi:hypothetical protein
MTIVKSSKTPGTDAYEAFIAAMWIMFLRAPGRKTGPGEPVDLGEIGQVKEKDWKRMTPYSTATPRRTP